MRPEPDDMGNDDQDLARVVDLLSSVTAEDEARDELPEGLWDSIAARMTTADQPTVLAGRPELEVVADTDDHDDATPAPATVVDLDVHRRRRWMRVAAAAAAVVLVAGTFGIINANQPASVEVVASVDLDALKDAGSGTAELITVDGVEQIRITAQGLPAAPGGHHYEMWLIDPAITDIHSLGSLPSGQDEVVVDVPAGVDPEQYPIVDINLQVDGQEQHSGVDTSVLRGSLA